MTKNKNPIAEKDWPEVIHRYQFESAANIARWLSTGTTIVREHHVYGVVRAVRKGIESEIEALVAEGKLVEAEAKKQELEVLIPDKRARHAAKIMQVFNKALDQ